MRTETYEREHRVALTDDQVRKKTLEHIDMLTKIDELDAKRKMDSKDINEQIKELKKATKKLARVVVDKIEVAKVQVKEIPEWETKRVLIIRADSPEDKMVVLDARGMTLDEQQQELHLDRAGDEDKSDKAKDVTPKKENTKFRVELLEVGKKPIDIIKAVRERTNEKLNKVKSMLADTPKVIYETSDRASCETFAAELEKAGATVKVLAPDVLPEVLAAEAAMRGEGPKALPAKGETEGSEEKKDESPKKAEPVVSKESLDALANKFRKNSKAPAAGTRSRKERRPRA